jgi:hypothetical protein
VQELTFWKRKRSRIATRFVPGFVRKAYKPDKTLRSDVCRSFRNTSVPTPALLCRISDSESPYFHLICLTAIHSNIHDHSKETTNRNTLGNVSYDQTCQSWLLHHLATTQLIVL